MTLTPKLNARIWRPSLLAVLVLLLAPGAGAQQAEAPPQSATAPAPPLASLIAHGVLTVPPPAIGSPEDRADISAVEAAANAPDARWREAEADANALYPRFAAAFGSAINRTNTPRTYAVLNHALVETSQAVFAAKDRFRRLRPYQRFQLQHVCGKGAPRPDPHAADRSSYPSGHAAFGWMTASILSRLAPDRAAPLMQRANEYGESRVVCGMHYPSDVLAGEAVAEAVLARLLQNWTFRQELNQAGAEIAAIRPH